MRSPNLRSMAALLAAVIVGLASVASAEAEKRSSIPQTRLVGVVNVNTANMEELELLPGIGPSRARALIEYRKARGPFKAVGDLTQVSGIGDRALERIRPHCVLSGKTTAKLEH